MPKLKPFFWCLLISAANAARSDDCRTIQFRPETKNKFLENHMIRSMTVPSKSLCESQCYQEPNCVSYNYGPMHSDTPACDLNIGTHLQASSEDFILKDDYTYRDILNPCQSNPCPVNSTCQVGFTSKGYRCIAPQENNGEQLGSDVDECTLNTHDGSSKADCSNLLGSFQCACKQGFTGDGKTCQDVDECTLNTHDCSFNADCSNLLGSFQCSCKSGFTGDGKTCEDLDECTLNTHDCSSNADCSNLLGSFQCACNPGFTGDGKTCQVCNPRTTSGKCCSIPFEYKGKTYNSCTTDDWDKPWCSLDPVYQDNWGECA